MSAQEKADLRRKVKAHLLDRGFVIRSGRLEFVGPRDKESIRAAHSESVSDARKRAEPALHRREARLVGHLLPGDQLDPISIRPKLLLVDDWRSEEGALWRWASLHWSVPVSSGYGRRLRFLVVDEAHDDALIGVIGLSDPVIAMKARDSWIGWDAARRKEKLVNVLDAFCLGAVPPYQHILGGKLVALCATSTEVRIAFEKKYRHRTSEISGRDPDARLAAITTMSALGRSSMYNRLKAPSGRAAWLPVGYTQGTGDFHLSGGLYDQLASYASTVELGSRKPARNAKWGGAGFRNRREAIQIALNDLGMGGDALRAHGIQRQVYVGPLARNAQKWLTGDHSRLLWDTSSIDEIGSFWLKRWGLGRSERDLDWKKFDPDTWKLWT